MRFRAAISAAALVLAAGSALAGPLDPPPGAVTGSYKTLTQVEPRTPISAATTPGDASNVFRITQPGAYYLTANVDVRAFANGIQVDLASDGAVTIDLNGFSLVGRENSLNGIDVDGPFLPRVTIRNGYITTVDGSGVDTTGAESATIENVESTRNSIKGFVVPSGSLKDCKAQFNSQGGFKVGSNCSLSRCEAVTTGLGFETDADCTLVDCLARGSTGRGFDCDSSCVLTRCVATNNAIDGILVLFGCTLTDCTSSDNGERGFSVNTGCTLSGCVAMNNSKWGFSSGAFGTFQNCTAKGNTFAGFTGSFSNYLGCFAGENGLDGFALGGAASIRNCDSQSNAGNGISGGGACLVADNRVQYNGSHGIYLSLHKNTIRGNSCVGNGTSADGANIRTDGVQNRIEDNDCSDGDWGIQVTAAKSVIVRNTCGGNGVNWSIAANNSYGPIIDRTSAVTAPVNGSSAPASALGTTDANANFTR